MVFNIYFFLHIMLCRLIQSDYNYCTGGNFAHRFKVRDKGMFLIHCRAMHMQAKMLVQWPVIPVLSFICHSFYASTRSFFFSIFLAVFGFKHYLVKIYYSYRIKTLKFMLFYAPHPHFQSAELIRAFTFTLCLWQNDRSANEYMI